MFWLATVPAMVGDGSDAPSLKAAYSRCPPVVAENVAVLPLRVAFISTGCHTLVTSQMWVDALAPLRA